MWNKMSRKMNKGFTFIELMVVVLVVSIGMIGAMDVMTRTFVYARFVSSKLVAAYLAQEGIEIVRSIRDTNWIEKAENWDEDIVCCESTPCECQADYNDLELSVYQEDVYLKIDGGFYNYDPGSAIPSKFKRKISIDKPVSHEILIMVTITWKDHEIQIFEKLYDWK